MRRVIDLRSDTVTRPTDGMRRAIAVAEVGDDALGDDPTVRRLEERVAELLGKDAALFFPSGIMANEAALLALAPPGTEAVVEDGCHLVDWEDGAPAQWGGIQLRPVATPAGHLTPDAVRAAIRPASPFAIRTSLIALENTHNGAGGRVLPLDAALGIRAVAAEHGLPVHLDGARLWNAAVACGEPPASLAGVADTVMVTLSKGLGCPVGSLLALPAGLREEVWRIRRRLGGAMRQAGLLAAAGLYALDHHRERLSEDHRRARLLAEALAGLPGVRVVTPETNIVMLERTGGRADAAMLAARSKERGLLLSVFGPARLRAVTHLDVDDDDIREAAGVLAELLGDRVVRDAADA